MLFFFFREFQPMASALDDSSLLSNFLYRRGLNPRSLIQQSETLPVELAGTHIIEFDWSSFISNSFYFLIN